MKVREFIKLLQEFEDQDAEVHVLEADDTDWSTIVNEVEFNPVKHLQSFNGELLLGKEGEG
tara:strand:- start:2257 stop:2439 length:183 start_codon:yes stop_codon:yes gene_type:complete